jgi:L-fuculose-phosphate aldolase
MLAREQRQRVVDLCIALSRGGYLAATGGNVALRLDAEHFVVTPSGIDYFTMSAEDMCVIRLSDVARVDGVRAPSVETGLHARVLSRRPDVGCSIHTHQPLASAFALLGEALTVDDARARACLGPRVPIVGYLPSGTKPLAWLLGRAVCPDSNAYLMRNHGALCCGRDVEQATLAVETLERLAGECLRQRIAARAAADPAGRSALLGLVHALESA